MPFAPRALSALAHENIFIPAGPDCISPALRPALLTSLLPEVHEPEVVDTVNVHGHHQTQEDGCNVCSNCFVHYTNRGAGMACMTCQNELMAECALELG